MENRWHLISILILSLALHAMVTLSFLGLASLLPAQAPAQDIAEIELLPAESPTKQPQQIVRQAQVPEKLKQLNNDPARFLSEQEQRVKQEQRALLSGKTQNAAESSSRKPSLRELTQTSKDISGFHTKAEISPDGTLQKSKNSDDSDFQKALAQRPRTTSRPSTTGEVLPVDMTVGPVTALNTDRLTYYSFYERIEDLIRYRWESRITNAIDNFDQNYLRTVVMRRPWLTQAEFLIRPDGKLMKAMLMKPSGVSQFDLAALNAFKDAAVFPNPPKELIQSDGYVHLKYSFNVTYR